MNCRPLSITLAARILWINFLDLNCGIKKVWKSSYFVDQKGAKIKANAELEIGGIKMHKIENPDF